MITDLNDALLVLARSHGEQVRTCEILDPNLPERLYQEVRFDYQGRRASVTAGTEFACVSLRSNAMSAAVFSVNRADRIMLTRPSALRVGAKAWPVFVCDYPLSAVVEAMLSDPRVAHPVDRLALGTNDSLHVYGNQISTYLKSPILTRILDSLSAMGEIADRLEVPEEPLPLDVLPEEFHSLIPLMPRWGICDDEERSAVFDKATVSDLKKLIDEVWPQMERIKAYLDSPAAEQNYEVAAVLEALAQAASEANHRRSRWKQSQ